MTAYFRKMTIEKYYKALVVHLVACLSWVCQQCVTKLMTNLFGWQSTLPIQRPRPTSLFCKLDTSPHLHTFRLAYKPNVRTQITKIGLAMLAMSFSANLALRNFPQYSQYQDLWVFPTSWFICFYNWKKSQSWVIRNLEFVTANSCMCLS